MRFADGEPSYRVAWEIEVHELARALARQIGVRAALHDREQTLPRRDGGLGIGAPRFHRGASVIAAAARPFRRALDSGGGAFVLGGILDALVEHHRDVRTQRLLN